MLFDWDWEIFFKIEVVDIVFFRICYFIKDILKIKK